MVTGCTQLGASKWYNCTTDGQEWLGRLHGDDGPLPFMGLAAQAAHQDQEFAAHLVSNRAPGKSPAPRIHCPFLLLHGVQGSNSCSITCAATCPGMLGPSGHPLAAGVHVKSAEAWHLHGCDGQPPGACRPLTLMLCCVLPWCADLLLRSAAIGYKEGVGWFSLYQEQDAEPLEIWAARARAEGVFEVSHPVMMTNHSMQVRLQLSRGLLLVAHVQIWERGNFTGWPPRPLSAQGRPQLAAAMCLVSTCCLGPPAGAGHACNTFLATLLVTSTDWLLPTCHLNPFCLPAQLRCALADVQQALETELVVHGDICADNLVVVMMRGKLQVKLANYSRACIVIKQRAVVDVPSIDMQGECSQWPRFGPPKAVVHCVGCRTVPQDSAAV